LALFPHCVDVKIVASENAEWLVPLEKRFFVLVSTQLYKHFHYNQWCHLHCMQVI